MEKIIGKKIQEYRKIKGLTQEQLSEMLDITPHYMSSLERGLYNIKLELLVRILNILDCSADEIFRDVVNKSSLSRSNEISERLKNLPIDEQRKIFDVIDIMIKNANK